MKILNLTMLIALAAIILSSCKKDEVKKFDANTTIVGSWNTSDGGTITFNSDGSGTTTNSDFFEFDCGSVNGNRIGPIPKFEWTVANNGTNDNLAMEFSDSTSFTYPCSGSIEFPVSFTSENNGKVGTSILIDISVELTRQ